MGMYLDVNVVYGVAWGYDDCPAEAFPEYPEGHPNEGEQIDDGEPIERPGGTLVWGSHGNTLGKAERHLEVADAGAGVPQGRYAQRVPWEETGIDDMVRWDALIISYCTSLGMKPEQIPAPGWLALASFG